MNDPIATIRDSADTGYLAHAVLDQNALDTIRETNSGFLALVARRAAAWPGGGAYGLGAAAVAGIAALDAAGLRAAASCPYTLFNLRFGDAAFWADVARQPPRTGSGGLDDEATFARIAIYLAWHLAQSSEHAPALVLGMTPAVQRAWRALPLSAIDRAASAALPHLTARWGDHPSFWPKLVEVPVSEDRVRRQSVRLLGLQLLAADGIRADGAWAQALPGP